MACPVQKEKTGSGAVKAMRTFRGILQSVSHEVSGGQCQRAALARALAIESTNCHLVTKSTSALDVPVQQQILELLQEFKEKKKLSYLFICHNLALVQMFCDRVLVMKDGKIVEQGTPRR